MDRMKRFASCVLLSIVALYLAGCVVAKPRAYRDYADLKARSPEEVEVFWIAPEFEYARIGEVTVRMCDICDEAQLEREMRAAVAQIGGNIAVVASDKTQETGAIIVPGASLATVSNTTRRDLLVIAGLRGDETRRLPVATPGVEEAPEHGITITSDPAGAEVYIGGLLVGNTPVEKYPLEPGAHRIEVRAKGYRVWRRNLEVREAASVELRAELEASGSE